MHLSQAVANYFLQRGFDESKKITPLQVLKLTYIAHGWTLGYTGKALIKHEVVAWRLGPVIPILYHQFKHFRKSPITEFAGDFGPPYDAEYTPQQKVLLKGVWINYSNMNGTQLSELTHQKGTPWDQVWNKEGGSIFGDTIIPDEKIKEYYKALIPKRNSKDG